MAELMELKQMKYAAIPSLYYRNIIYHLLPYKRSLLVLRDTNIVTSLPLVLTRIRQEDLLHLKDQVFQTGQNLEEKQTILDEVRAERKVLHSELNRYIAMVKQVQKDLELVRFCCSFFIFAKAC